MGVTKVCGTCEFYAPVEFNDDNGGVGKCECPMPLWYESYTCFQSRTMPFEYPAFRCPLFKYTTLYAKQKLTRKKVGK